MARVPVFKLKYLRSLLGEFRAVCIYPLGVGIGIQVKLSLAVAGREVEPTCVC